MQKKSYITCFLVTSQETLTHYIYIYSSYIYIYIYIYIFDTKHKCIMIIDVSPRSTKKYNHMSHVFAYFVQIFKF